ncbi:hypothetical protein D1007_53575 [Hordeum vulgare]|nr:hypothetical protein D1007_53575 [Hordeum vulgare]
MSNARHVRAECRETQVVANAPAGPGTRCHFAGVEDATTDPAICEKHTSSMHPSMQREGRTSKASSSHARLERVNAQATLLMARELLRYHPANVAYDAWLGCITEFITAAGVAQAPSRLLCPLHHAMEMCLRERRHLLPCTATRLSPDMTRARATRLMNHPHMPKKKKIAARSSTVRLRSTRARSSSSSVSAWIGSSRMSKQLGAKIGPSSCMAAPQAP